MKEIGNVTRPSKDERALAMESYDALSEAIRNLDNDSPEIVIEETEEKIRVPLNALNLLRDVLKAISKGNMVSIVPIATEMTTQAAADLLGCSRPHFVKLLESGEIPFTKVGKHRRVMFEDVISHKKQMKQKQKRLLIEMMSADEESGLYDT